MEGCPPIYDNPFSYYDYSLEFLVIFDFGVNFGFDGNGNVAAGHSLLSFKLYKFDNSTCEFSVESYVRI